jgi:hypothetical protein
MLLCLVGRDVVAAEGLRIDDDLGLGLCLDRVDDALGLEPGLLLEEVRSVVDRLAVDRIREGRAGRLHGGRERQQQHRAHRCDAEGESCGMA